MRDEEMTRGPIWETMREMITNQVKRCEMEEVKQMKRVDICSVFDHALMSEMC